MTTLTKLLTTVAIVMTCFVMAQDFQGVATYKSHRKFDLKTNDKNENSEMNKEIQAQLQKQFQREYTLTFNKNETIYKKEEQLSKPQPSSSGFIIEVSDGSDIMYKNLKENRYVNKTEMFGKLFLIRDSLQTRKWELVNETKNIGDYTCFKAIFKDTITTQKHTEEGGLTKKEEERITTAWYTPQIPVNSGPQEFHGLPGLILEINDGKLTLVCSKIVINPKEKLRIEEPKKGKIVSQKKFDEIMEKKNKEMMERFHSRKGDGDNVFIKIGG
jgi:GLPGLI family protein